MTTQGVLILIAFFIFAGLMITKKLPTILALPLMAFAICAISQMSMLKVINVVILGGSTKLSSAIAVVVFGAMFAKIIMKTGISDSIIKKAAELAGDKPMPIAIVLTAAIAFVFLGMNGLGAIIMVGSIAIPIMISAGIRPVVASSLLLLGMQTGLSANAANYGTFIGIFGGNVVSSYYGPAAIISSIVTLAFIIINVRSDRERSAWAMASSNGIMKTNKKVPAIALITPIIPIAIVFLCKGIWGFGPANKGMVDAVGASIFGFIVASIYGIIVTQPKQIVNIFSGAIVEGIQEVAGVIFLFIGIGMLVVTVTNPIVSQYLNPIIKDLVPSSRVGILVFFAVLSPLALYRGPLNMFGMGAGIAALIVSLKILPIAVVAGGFVAVQYIQAVSDPTNSQNVWTGEYANVETSAILKMTIPYTWVMCVAMLGYTIAMKW